LFAKNISNEKKERESIEGDLLLYFLELKASVLNKAVSSIQSRRV